MLGDLLHALRQGLLTEPAAPVAPEPALALAERLEAASQRRLGRSLALLHVETGGCGGCASELRALDGVLYDLRRFGLEFVSTPRQADVLVVTGPLTRNAREALALAWRGMAEPKWVVALGECAVDGGPFRGSYAVEGGVEAALPVDLVVSGCPPTPAAMLSGLRALLEANAG
jgi:Ni,Fe-hydrogenase III small subunit